ncbi:MAG: hypothetical protein ACRDQ0_04000, partial [Pseudonocardia sp.]
MWTILRTTRHSKRRLLLFSVQLGTVLTGWPMYALGAAMMGSMAHMLNPSGHASWWLVGALSVDAMIGVMTFVPRFAAVLVGFFWTPLQQLLGSRGWTRGPPEQVHPDQPLVDDARVIVGTAVLGVVTVVPAMAALMLVPGFWSGIVSMIAGAVYTGLARTPFNDWTAGSAGATLINTAKGGAVWSGYMLFGVAAGAAATGLDTAFKEHKDTTSLLPLIPPALDNLFVLAVGVMTVILVWASGLRTLRIAPLKALPANLPHELARRIEAAGVVKAVLEFGIGDVGLASAIFLGPARTPAQQDRLDRLAAQILPDAADRALLAEALTTYLGDRPGGLGRAVAAAVGEAYWLGRALVDLARAGLGILVRSMAWRARDQIVSRIRGDRGSEIGAVVGAMLGSRAVRRAAILAGLVVLVWTVLVLFDVAAARTAPGAAQGTTSPAAGELSGTEVWAIRAAALAGVVALTRIWTAYRQASWAWQLLTWARTPAARVDGLRPIDVVLVLSELQRRWPDKFQGGMTRDKLIAWAPILGSPAHSTAGLAAAARRVAQSRKPALEKALEALTDGVLPLVIREDDAGSALWRANELLVGLWARGPPAFRLALANDAAAALAVDGGARGLEALSASELAKLLFDRLQDVNWRKTEMRSRAGWRAWVPGVV